MTNKHLRIYNNKEYLRLSVDETIARNYNKWKDWKCYAGVKNLYIDYNGNIFTCNTAGSNAVLFNRKAYHKYLDKKLYGKGKATEETKNIHLKNWLKKKEAFSRLIKPNEEKGCIGNIFSEYELPKDIMTCPFDSCSCGADVLISKYKSDKDFYLPVTSLGFDGHEHGTEVSNITKPTSVEMQWPVPYQILWDLTRRCNYNCSYCWAEIHNKVEKFIDINIIIKTIDSLLEWSSKKEIRFNFGGGEPTLHPNFIDILSYLQKNNQWVLVTSNMSRSLDFWKECSKYIHSINMSAHFESMDKQHFIDVLKIFIAKQDKINIEVKLMTPPGKLQEVLEFKKDIKNLRLDNDRMKGTCSLVPIRSIEVSGKLLNYNEHELYYFQNQ